MILVTSSTGERLQLRSARWSSANALRQGGIRRPLESRHRRGGGLPAWPTAVRQPRLFYDGGAARTGPIPARWEGRRAPRCATTWWEAIRRGRRRDHERYLDGGKFPRAPREASRTPLGPRCSASARRVPGHLRPAAKGHRHSERLGRLHCGSGPSPGRGPTGHGPGGNTTKEGCRTTPRGPAPGPGVQDRRRTVTWGRSPMLRGCWSGTIRPAHRGSPIGRKATTTERRPRRCFHAPGKGEDSVGEAPGGVTWWPWPSSRTRDRRTPGAEKHPRGVVPVPSPPRAAGVAVPPSSRAPRVTRDKLIDGPARGGLAGEGRIVHRGDPEATATHQERVLGRGGLRGGPNVDSGGAC